MRPTTRYAKSGNVHVAYQVFGDGLVDLVFVPGFISNIENYWVPSEPDQASPYDTVSLIYDDRRLLETRVRRLASPRIYSQEPRSRTSRIVTNVTFADSEASDSTRLVRSKFQMVEFRRDEQRIFAGTYFHRLLRQDGEIRIAAKRINLVNCDGPMDGLVVPF